jgi:hypothetical protein
MSFHDGRPVASLAGAVTLDLGLEAAAFLGASVLDLGLAALLGFEVAVLLLGLVEATLDAGLEAGSGVSDADAADRLDAADTGMVG